MLKAKRPRPPISNADRAFWLLLRRLWPRWDDALVIVQPETVVRWHRSGFRLFWRWKSRRRRRTGRPKVSSELRALIRRMANENPSWGAPRIHGELLKLGFDVSERTVLRYMPRRPASPGSVERWRAFLLNHREAIAAMDLFAVPTVTFRVLYVFFVMHHGSRKVLHVDVTANPTAHWIAQQLRETFSYDHGVRYLIHDNDKKFGSMVLGIIKAMGVRSKPTSFRSPWQNGLCERWILGCRRELLDHVVPLGAAHLRRLLLDYVRYFHDDRTHLGLSKETPSGREANAMPSPSARVVALPRIGGVHHRYEWRDAA